MGVIHFDDIIRFAILQATQSHRRFGSLAINDGIARLEPVRFFKTNGISQSRMNLHCTGSKTLTAGVKWN